MPLVRLRTQMLMAIGLPACWTGPVAEPPVTPTKPVKPVSLAFDPGACARDSVPETVCGERRETLRTCGAKATALSTVDEFKLYVTEEDSDDPATAYREFVFDRDETRRYREQLDDPTSAPSYCCYSQCTPLVVGKADPVTPQPGYYIEDKCMPAPPNGTSKPAKEDPACAAGVAFEGTLRPYTSSEGGECCYSVPTRNYGRAIPGRALRIDGVLHVADVADGAGWDAALCPAPIADAALRERLAAAWLEIAQLEHASIASFASLSLRLLAAGAPADLIAAAHRAALDEIEHARIAFELASAYGGRRVGPGKFDIATRAPVAGTLRELALETFVDGCINETTAAHQAEVAAAGASDPAVADALCVIAADEARHAQLAWAVVAWCVRSGVVSVAELREIAADPRPAARPRNEDLAPHGVLGDLAAADVQVAVMHEVIAPCLAALA